MFFRNRSQIYIVNVAKETFSIQEAAPCDSDGDHATKAGHRRRRSNRAFIGRGLKPRENEEDEAAVAAAASCRQFYIVVAGIVLIVCIALALGLAVTLFVRSRSSRSQLQQQQQQKQSQQPIHFPAHALDGKEGQVDPGVLSAFNDTERQNVTVMNATVDRVSADSWMEASEELTPKANHSRSRSSTLSERLNALDDRKRHKPEARKRRHQRFAVGNHRAVG